MSPDTTTVRCCIDTDGCIDTHLGVNRHAETTPGQRQWTSVTRVMGWAAPDLQLERLPWMGQHKLTPAVHHRHENDTSRCSTVCGLQEGPARHGVFLALCEA
jgi:hypothetical protein